MDKSPAFLSSHKFCTISEIEGVFLPAPYPAKQGHNYVRGPGERVGGGGREEVT